MKTKKVLTASRKLSIVLALLLSNSVNAQWSKRGDISAEVKGFTDSALHTADHSTNVSLSGNAEFNHAIGDNGFFTISPFFRIDQHDDERTHFDLREFNYLHSGDNWELKVGLGKVFWGVAESSNIVDIINQKDAIEGSGAQHKLGQPMINLLLLKDWGEISLFVLPGFRERTFAGSEGRPRGFFPINTSGTEYESNAENKHIDVAARVSGSYNEWDVGAHVFHGTAREPLLIFPTVSPYYYQVTQVGIDLQATFESWLLKLETVSRSGKYIDNHEQVVTGFEYSFYSVAESSLDIGVVAEWLYDNRGASSSNVFQNDLLTALRFALNDEQSSEALIGVISDLDGGAKVISMEASRRLADQYKLSLQALIWAKTKSDSILSQFGQEDYIQASFAYYF